MTGGQAWSEALWSTQEQRPQAFTPAVGRLSTCYEPGPIVGPASCPGSLCATWGDRGSTTGHTSEQTVERLMHRRIQQGLKKTSGRWEGGGSSAGAKGPGCGVWGTK